MTILYRLLMLAFLALLPFQDSILRNTPLRALGASLSVFPLVGLLMLGCWRWLYKPKLMIGWLAIVCVGYACLTTFGNLFVFGLESHGVNLLGKALGLGILTALFLGPLYLDYGEERIIRIGLSLAFGLCVAALVAGDLGLAPSLVNNPVMHATENTDSRPRGLASEASNFSIQVITLGLLCMHYTRSSKNRVIVGAAALGALILCGSKGGFLTLLATTVLIVFMSKDVRRGKLVLALVLAVPIFVVFYQITATQVAGTLISETTTVATRATLAVWSGITIMENPWGVGLAGFLPALPKNLPQAMDFVNSHADVPLNFSEVSQYATSAEYASTKVFLLQYSVIFGVPFTIAFFWFIGRVVREANRRHLLVLAFAVIFTSISISTYIDGLSSFNISLVFGVTLHAIKKAESTPRC